MCTVACRCDPSICQNCQQTQFLPTASGRKRAAPPQKEEHADEESAEDTQFRVDRLVDHRLKKGCKSKLEFLVRWEGYGPESDTWEPRVNIEGSLIQAYTNA